MSEYGNDDTSMAAIYSLFAKVSKFILFTLGGLLIDRPIYAVQCRVGMVKLTQDNDVH
jgi:hypothetical protein